MYRLFRATIIYLIIVSSLVGCGPAPAQSSLLSPTPTPNPLAVAIDQYLNNWVESDNFSGAVLVARDGKILFSKAYGMANVEQRIPFTTRTQLRIYGLTESFTAAAVLMLQNASKLNVQDTFCQHFADCPQAWKEITIHQLLTHTSGLPDYIEADHSQKDTRMTCAQLVDWYKPRPIVFKPGERWGWTNIGYNLLGCMIENISGKPFGAFLKETIFDPLQMIDTGYDPDWKSTTIVYKTYAVPETLTLDMSLFFANAGLHSSLEDLYRWDQALYTEKLLPQKLLAEGFRTYTTTAPPYYDMFGYGWYLNDFYGHRLIAQGSFDITKSLIWRFPDDHATILLLSNNEWLNPITASSFIAAELFK